MNYDHPDTCDCVECNPVAANLRGQLAALQRRLEDAERYRERHLATAHSELARANRMERERDAYLRDIENVHKPALWAAERALASERAARERAEAALGRAIRLMERVAPPGVFGTGDLGVALKEMRAFLADPASAAQPVALPTSPNCPQAGRHVCISTCFEPPVTQASPETRAMLQTLTQKWPAACSACGHWAHSGTCGVNDRQGIADRSCLCRAASAVPAATPGAGTKEPTR